MKIPAIKKLVETYSAEQLAAAEEAIMEEQALAIEVEGDDEGEQLTHILAAIFVLEDIKENGSDFRAAIRKYTQKVRNSIS